MSAKKKQEKIRWPELSRFGIYLAYTEIIGIGEKLIIVDLKGTANTDELLKVNIKKVDWTPKNCKDIYYLDTAERKFRPNVIVQAFGVADRCPMSEDYTAEEIINNLNTAYIQKAEENLRRFAKQSIPLGKNYLGLTVFEFEKKRYFKKGKKYYFDRELPQKTLFLSAIDTNGQVNPLFIRQCLVNTAKTILQGQRVSSKDLEQLGRTILEKKEIEDYDRYLIQEALESVLYESFALLSDLPDKQTFNLSLNAYLAQPKRLIKASDTVKFGQFSTPLPMATIAQNILLKAISPTRNNPSILEPTIGHGALVSILSRKPNLSIFGYEIDPTRITLFNNIKVNIGDATKLDLTSVNRNQKFDYTISNPPFGKMSQKINFNNEVTIQKIDYFIALKTLEARKNDGYSVFILSADGPFSDGELKGGSLHFYNYIYDNYQIDGHIEIDSNLYQRNGANTNVRILAIGSKFDSPAKEKGLKTPKKIQLIKNYDELKKWGDVIENHISKISHTGAHAGIPTEMNQTYDLFYFAEHSTDLMMNVEEKRSTHKISQTRLQSDISISAKDYEKLESKTNSNTFKEDIRLREANELQLPYQSASKLHEATTMIPINMASGTYKALEKIKLMYPDIDKFVSNKLEFSLEELGCFFSAEQIDALALAIFNHEQYGRAVINADQTGIGKGRFVAGLMRYSRLNGHTPIFMTYKPSLMSDIFRDIKDIGSEDLFKKIFVINNTPINDIFNPEKKLYKSMSYQNHKKIIESKAIPEDTDIILCTYSQFNLKFERSPKSQFLKSIANQAFFFLDESHNATGESNTFINISSALNNAKGCMFSSATALKTIKSFNLYKSVFPATINTDTLADLLAVGGENLQEALATSMSEDGVLIRREHDLSKLTIRDIDLESEQQLKNRIISDQVASILAKMSLLSNEVNKESVKLNEKFTKEYEELDDSIKYKGQGRMQASTMNFGSRLYNTTRQFLLALQIDQSIEQAINDLENNIKPVIGVENTGESLVTHLINSKIFNREQLNRFEELTENPKFTLKENEKQELSDLIELRSAKLENFYFDEIPQFKDYLMLLLNKLRKINIEDEWGINTTQIIADPNYLSLEQEIAKEIENLPNTLPLIPLDYFKDKLQEKGYLCGEVSGRSTMLEKVKIEKEDNFGNKIVKNCWKIKVNNKSNATTTISQFQNGDFDAIIITKSGSTGYSMHSSPRFKDIRQRDFILLQKAANVAEYLQWIGRVNRKDQVVAPLVTNLSTGLPAELRLTMMHNAKLRKLSANVTSNRQNNNIINHDIDFLNSVGNEIALNFLILNRKIASDLKINLPLDLIDANFGENYYINKLMSRLVLLPVETQESIISDLASLFSEKIEELNAKGINPFQVKVHDWKAKIIKSFDLSSFMDDKTISSFDTPVSITTLQFEIKRDSLSAHDVENLVCNYLVENEQGQEFDHIFEDNLMGSMSRKSKLIRLSNLIHQNLMNRCFNLLPQKIRDKLGTASKIETQIENWMEHGNFAQQLEIYKQAQSALKFQHFDVGEYFNIITDLGEIKTGRVVGLVLPKNKSDISHSARLGIMAVVAGDEKPIKLNLLNLHTIRHMLNEKNVTMELEKSATQKFEKEIIDVSNRVLTKQVRVMTNNMFKATEMAFENKIGSPILYTDENGIRQRAILLNSNFSYYEIEDLPVKFNGQSIINYCNHFFANENKTNLENGNPIFKSQMSKKSHVPLNIEFRITSPDKVTFLIHDIKKPSHCELIRDTSIFASNETPNQSGLGLKLSGRNNMMYCELKLQDLISLLNKLQDNYKLNGIYLMNPDQSILRSLKDNIKIDENELTI